MAVPEYAIAISFLGVFIFDGALREMSMSGKTQQALAAGSRSNRYSLRLVTVAGCLAMVFVTGVMSPAWTEFCRSVGATERHFGLLAGIPLVMIFFQFVGAAVTNRIRHRKGLFMSLIITSRLLYIPICLLPFLRDWKSTDQLMLSISVLVALSSALGNMVTPLWFSWMADLVPGRVLNRYWGTRQTWMFWTWAACYIALAAFTRFSPLDIRLTYPLIVCIGVTAGVIDILLFIGVREPENETHSAAVFKMLLAPLRDRQYGGFVAYSCLNTAGVMCAAAFMQLYVLKELGLSVWQTTLIWCVPGVGSALSSKGWGRLADRHGHKPVMVICTFFKPIIVIVFMILTPHSALWLLPVVYLVDGMWNAGNMLAANGFMMKIAPRQNRSMFIAAMVGLAGISGGLAAMGGGFFLEAMSGWSTEFAGRTWTNYHVLFSLSLAIRIVCAFLVRRIHEPQSSAPIHVLSDVFGVWPLRFIRFPVGLYRRG